MILIVVPGDAVDGCLRVPLRAVESVGISVVEEEGGNIIVVACGVLESISDFWVATEVIMVSVEESDVSVPIGVVGINDAPEPDASAVVGTVEAATVVESRFVVSKEEVAAEGACGMIEETGVLGAGLSDRVDAADTEAKVVTVLSSVFVDG